MSSRTPVARWVMLAAIALLASSSAASAATMSAAVLADFDNVFVQDFDSVPLGAITDVNAVFAAVGIASISATVLPDQIDGNSYDDTYQKRNNASRALWFDASGLRIVEPGSDPADSLGNYGARYEIDFFDSHERFGFTTHDESPFDPEQFFIVDTFMDGKLVGTFSSAGLLMAGASDPWDRRDLFFHSTERFNRVVIRTAGNAGFGLDNFAIERRVPAVPEPGTLGLLGLGLLALAARRRA